MVLKNCFFLIFILLISTSGEAQHNNFFFDVTGGGGALVPHHPELKHLGGPAAFFNARFGVKPRGKKEWQRVYKYPEYGIGLSHNYLTSKSLGNPFAVYSFINLPLTPDSKIKLYFRMNLGIAWGFNKYSEQNQENIAIGSYCSAYAAANLNTSFKISENLDILLSAGGYHYSNGNLNKPNKGLNLIGAETGLRYSLSKSSTSLNTRPVSPVDKSSAIEIFGAWGTKKEATYSSFYKAGTLSAGYFHTLNHKSRICAGVDMFYDEGTIYYTQKRNILKNTLAVGIIGGHELTFAKFSIGTQLGIYIRNPNPNDPFYYERLTMRYFITQRIIPSLSIKAHEFKVDFIEWGIGFVLWKS